jgi:hypothetical protein
MRRSKGREEPESEVTERVVVRREPIPTARAILWKPLPDSYHLLASMMRSPEQQTYLFITQRAFLQVERHLASALDLDLGGFLAGHLYECPRTRVRYSIVNTTVPFAEVTGDPIGRRVTEREYNAVRTRLDAHGLALIGWYRNGAGLGLQLLPDDVETHLAYFSTPWQTTMLVLPDASRPRGAFFTYDPRVGRGYCIPFYELFDADGTDRELRARTCVTWRSYVPAVPVQPMPAEDREIAEITVKPIRSEPEPTPSDPIDEWWDAIKDPWVRLKDVATSAAQPDDVPAAVVWRPNGPATAPEPVEMPLLTPLPTRETVPDEPRAIAPVAPVATPPTTSVTAPPTTPVTAPPTPSVTVPPPQAANVSRPVPPFVGPARPMSRPVPFAQPIARPVTPPPSASTQKPSSATPPPARPSPCRTPQAPRPIPAAKAAAMAKAATPILVEVPPDLEERAMVWQRRRRIAFAVAAASFLGVGVLSTVRTRTQQVAQAATPAVVMDSTTPSEDAVTIATAPVENARPLSLPAAVDSLSRAIARYRVVENGHRQGVVGCQSLDRAHSTVLRARSTMDASRGRITGTLDVADSLRVSMVRAEYMHIAQLYRRSGCQP